MTWQLVDENTYIDNSLVTCAEYQLFIDEMREQGKYYQPDHWTSYQFSEGLGRAPILGIRFNDARAFCKWLTKREAKNWEYRLFSNKEEKDNPLRSSSTLLEGYWLEGSFNQSQFAWVNSKPNDARHIERSMARDINLALDEGLNQILERTRGEALSTAFKNAIVRPLDLDFPYELKLEIDFERDLDPYTYLTQETEEVNESGLDDESEIDNEYEEFNYWHIDIDWECALRLAKDRNLQINRTYKLSFAIDTAFVNELNRGLSDGVRDLDIYMDLLTLQQRLAGRSPAFEGIRLVRVLK